MLTKTPETELQDIDGLSLSYRLRQAQPRQRAALAKELVLGEKRIGRLTRTQASAICNVPLPLVNQEVNGQEEARPETVARERDLRDLVATGSVQRSRRFCSRLRRVRGVGRP
jgi:hypothetical protein